MPEIGVPELLIILLIILVLFGGGRIAKLAGELGSAIRSFREGLRSEKPADDKQPKP
jgi:sec-independent protein translocase protein TatA